MRWALRPPTRLRDRAFEDLENGAAHGAAGVHLRGVEHDMFLCDPYFFPLYERAQDLNLPILIHNGSTIRLKPGIPIGNFTPQPPALMHQLVNLLCPFHAVLGSDVSQRFPRLRRGFLEDDAAYTLPVLQQHARRDMSIGLRPFLDPRPSTPDHLNAMNMNPAA